MKSLSLFPVQLQVPGRQGTVIGLFTEFPGAEKIMCEWNSAPLQGFDKRLHQGSKLELTFKELEIFHIKCRMAVAK